MENDNKQNVSAQDIASEAESGGRSPSNPIIAKFIIYLALSW